MQGTSARTVRGGRSFAVKPGIGIPANLVLFWLVLDGFTFEVALSGIVGGLAGALLLTGLERLTHSDVQGGPGDAATWRAEHSAGFCFGDALT